MVEGLIPHHALGPVLVAQAVDPVRSTGPRSPTGETLCGFVNYGAIDIIFPFSIFGRSPYFWSFFGPLCLAPAVCPLFLPMAHPNFSL